MRRALRRPAAGRQFGRGRVVFDDVGPDPRAFTCRANTNIAEFCRLHGLTDIYVYVGQGKGRRRGLLLQGAPPKFPRCGSAPEICI